MTKLEKAAFGMGCFWGPDALFGSLDGVVRTRVGYAGGEKKDPTYQDLGNHTETVLVEFDPEKISYEELLEVFWENHDYTKKRKPQYQSKIFYIGDSQKQVAEESLSRRTEAVTELQELETFYIAEDYHQKYKLRNSDLMEEFEEMDDDEFRDSALTAKANAVAAGYLDKNKYESYRQKLD